MKATFNTTTSSNVVNYGNEKETIDTRILVAIEDGYIETIATLRFYMGRSRNASKVYASLWVHGKGHYMSGTGSAGGYGYCKKSAAADRAIESAGIVLNADIDGRGMCAVNDAMKAIGESLGYVNPKVLIA